MRLAGAAGAAGVAGALVGACAPDSGAPPAARRLEASIRFAAVGNATERPVWEQITGAYNELKTGITVEYEPCTAPDCLDHYFNQFVAGSAPDTWRIDDEPLPLYADRGTYHELDGLLSRDSREINPADFFPRSLESYRYDRAAGRHGQGKLYALPFNTGGDMIWVNKRLFQEAGLAPPPADGNWTMEQFVDLARKTTSFEGGGQMRTAGLATRPAFRGSMAFLWSAGARFLDDSGKRWTMTAPETVRAYEWFVDLRRRHQVVPGPTDFQGQGNPFLAGRGAMWSAFAVVRPDILARAAEVPEWDVTHYPKTPDGKRYTRETSDGLGMAAQPKQTDAGWAFIKYLASTDGMKVQAKLGRAVPARKSVASSPDYIRPDTPQHEENLVKALEYSRLQPITFMFPSAERVIGRYEAAMFDPAAPLPPARAMQQLQDVLDKLERDRALPEGWEPKT
jgi:multiple sugar transport system substrate-binding protein